jgi:hypothetical protein
MAFRPKASDRDRSRGTDYRCHLISPKALTGCYRDGARIALTVALISLASGCDDWDDDEDTWLRNEVSDSWFGVADSLNDGAGFASFGLTLDESGDITDIEQDGTDTGLEAELIAEGSDFLYYRATNQAELVVYVDETRQYMFFVEIDGDFIAFLQRDADTLPSSETTDAVGSFDGHELLFDEDWDPTAREETQIEITGSSAPLSAEFQEGSGCLVEALLNPASTTFGTYTGTYQSSNILGCPGPGDVKHYLSPDKHAALSIACETFEEAAVPAACSIALVSK